MLAAGSAAAFGPLFRALPQELLAKIMPAERTVMLCRVSKGARLALMAAKHAAVVKAKGQCKWNAGLGEHLCGMMSWCAISVLDLSWVALGPANVESSLQGILGKSGS